MPCQTFAAGCDGTLHNCRQPGIETLDLLSLSLYMMLRVVQITRMHLLELFAADIMREFDSELAYYEAYMAVLTKQEEKEA